MIELNGAYLSNSDHDPSHSSQRFSPDTLRFEYTYDRGDMISARPPDSSDLFWVAQVEKVHKNNRGISENLTVRWYEPSGNAAGDPFEATYIPAVITKSSRMSKSCFPWTDEISVSTILVTFGSLSRKNKIKSYTAKNIRDALNT